MTHGNCPERGSLHDKYNPYRGRQEKIHCHLFSLFVSLSCRLAQQQKAPPFRSGQYGGAFCKLCKALLVDALALDLLSGLHDGFGRSRVGQKQLRLPGTTFVSPRGLQTNMILNGMQ